MSRTASISRKTNETNIQLKLNIDGTGQANIATGIGFFDHMLDLLTRHSGFDLELQAKGDLEVDHHHTVEDVGICLGKALQEALGDRRGIKRYASIDMPMDETLTRCAIDISGRSVLVFQTRFNTNKIGEFDTQLVEEWFRAFTNNAGITLHIATHYGGNDHHIAESCFKGLAYVLRFATSIDTSRADIIPSTKGSLS